MEIIYHRLESTPSTIAWAEEHLTEFDQEVFTVITAEEQTAGRGRVAPREWYSPPGLNLYFTGCLFLEELSPDLPYIPQVMAVELCELLEEEGFEPHLRWPNDILLNQRKVAGVMADTKAVKGGYFLLASLGLNVNARKKHLSHVGQPATSLYVESGRTFDREQLLERFSTRFITALSYHFANGFDDLHPRVTQRLLFNR